MKCLMRRSLITTLMLCFPAVTAFGQGTATVFGQVSDASGAVIPGVRVTVTNVNTNARRETIADEQGGFLIASLPVGVYLVEAEQNGFKRYVEQNVQLQVDERRAINVTMQAGAISESISVTSNPAQVETRSGALKEVIDSARIVQLPLNGRNTLELQRLVPGAGGVAAADQAQNQSLSVNSSCTNPNNNQSSAQSGRITGTAGAPRVIQFGLKYAF